MSEMSFDMTREVCRDLLTTEFPFEQIALLNGEDELQEVFHVENGYPGCILSIHVFPDGPIYNLTWSVPKEKT